MAKNISTPVKPVCFVTDFSKSLASPLCLTILSRTAACVTVLETEGSWCIVVQEHTTATTTRSLTGSNYLTEDYLDSLKIFYKTQTK